MVYLTGGLFILILGAELLVRGASKLASLTGIPPLIIGLIIVAFGTSFPELAVSFYSAVRGQNGLAVGNVVGSNIFNVLFVLGLTALITPLKVARRFIRADVLLMLVASSLVMIFALDHRLEWLEGLILFNALILYVVFLIHQSYQEKKRIKAEYAAEFAATKTVPLLKKQYGMMIPTAIVLLGAVLLWVGSDWVVIGAVQLAQAVQLDEAIIGLTVVAVGTSLPELATSLVACLKSERDIAVGNIVGSNIFNLFGVLGVATLFAKEGLLIDDRTVWFDIPVMLVVAFACLPMFFSGSRIERWEGAIFLFYYAVYCLYLVLVATSVPELDVYHWSLWLFTVPFVMLTLAISWLRGLRRAPHLP